MVPGQHIYPFKNYSAVKIGRQADNIGVKKVTYSDKGSANSHSGNDPVSYPHKSDTRGTLCVEVHRKNDSDGGSVARQPPCPDLWNQVNITQIKLRRSEEHTSELQSRGHLVCRLLLE